MNLACRGLAFLPTDCAAWLLGREADGPVNVFEASAGLFPLLNGRELPFEAALDFLQFAYTADKAGAYVAPASTVLVPPAVSEGEDVFAALLAHLRKRYPEVYGLGDTLAWAPERRETQIRAGEGISDSNLSVTSNLNLVAYAGILDHLNLAGINNTSHNLTTAYLDTPCSTP